MTTAASPNVLAPRRRLGLFDVLCIGVNAIVGSGVFALPDDMQRAMGGWSPLAYLLCAVVLLPVALCFAELAGRYEETGGPYLYAQRAFGDRIGYVVGWFCWTTAFVSWAANTTLFVELLGLRGALGKAVCAGVILGLGAVNYIGVKLGAWVVNAVVVGKLLAIFCFLGVALLAVDPSRLGGPLPHGLAGVGTGVYLALFPLQGFEVTPVPAGEVKDPRRTIPLATVGSLLFAALLFIVVQAALVATYPAIGQESQTPLADAAAHLGPRIGLLVLVGSFVSIGGFNAGSALGSPRYAQAIAARGLLPAQLAKVHPRFQTPHLAIAVTTGFSALLAICFDYRRLVGMSNLTIVVQYACTCLAVPVLRRIEPQVEAAAGAPRRWVVPGGVLIPFAGAAGSISLLAGAERVEFAFAAGILALGALVAFLARRSASSPK
ncbi:MAG TPA: APC family permease [Candidatus Nanopelagicales bacterium]|nr:APC family permease [Candidatus Nanopelagicales bacterium]